ncbi:MAG: hypothetical protein AAF732_07930 [Pseudomonadota bacterium]
MPNATNTQEPDTPGPDTQRPDQAKVRDVRGRVAGWAMIFSLGAITLAFGYSANHALLMPGPLTPPHSTVKDCKSCHANVADGTLGWVHNVITTSRSNDDSTACLACHPSDRHATGPHGLPIPELKRVSERQSAKHPTAKNATATDNSDAVASLAFRTASIHESGHDKVACATCHQEHREPTSNNAQCQACHRVRFDAFDGGHPEFVGYPFQSKTRITFDHMKHFKQHFPESRSKRPDTSLIPDNCSHCHTENAATANMAVKPFTETCATCHLPQIVGVDRATGPKGVALLALPGLDLETLREKNAAIGSWPADSEADFPPLLRFLLAAETKHRAILRTVDKLDLQDLSEASRDDIAAVTDLVWAIKFLVHDLATKRASQILKRIAGAKSPKIDRRLLVKLLGTLPRDVVLEAQRKWLPNLASEIEFRAQPNWRVAILALTQAQAVAIRTKRPSKDRDDERDTRPQDRLVKNPKAGRWYVSVLGEIVQEGGESEETLRATKGDIEQPKPKPTARAANPASWDVRSKTAPTLNTASVDDESWAELGGWYRQDHAILYRPTGHADVFIQAWLDLLSRQLSNIPDPGLSEAFTALTGKDGPGRCAKCHSVEKTEDAKITMHWAPASSRIKRERFTKFRHSPHFSLLDDRGCLTCHELSTTDKKTAAANATTDPHASVGNFKQIEKATCTTCHNTATNTQSCDLCHTYHVAPISTPEASKRVKSIGNIQPR